MYVHQLIILSIETNDSLQMCINISLQNTAKPVHEVNAIKHSPVRKGHIVLSQKISNELKLFQEVACFITPLCLCHKGILLIQV